MKKITIHQCEYCSFTGTSRQVKSHEKECAKVEEARLKQEEDKKLQRDYANSLRLNAESVSDFAKRVEAYIRDTTQEDIKISFRVNYGDFCSNTHKCPIGGELNWDRNSKRHLGYPGLTGSIYLKKAKQSGQYCGDYIENIPGINTDCGGGGYNSEYSVTLFLDDFPKIKAKVEEVLELEKLKQEHDKVEHTKYDTLCGIINTTIIEDPYVNQLTKELSEITTRLDYRKKELRDLCKKNNDQLLPIDNPYIEKVKEARANVY